ncbi:MAG: pitrilysin family protein [Candidatus Moranbacteria bacterium]|nr:pitrilysin family protein [Candidatus Moranbacteria bacterium]
MDFKKTTLKNGTRVVFVPMKDTQTVTVEILVEAGSKYETKKNSGMSHFLEHMMFKGTKKRPDAKIIAEELDSVGGSYNAFTGKEQTGYWVKVPRRHLDMALDVVSDMYLHSLLEEKEIKKEKGVILQEKSMYQDTPMRYVWDVFEELLYGDQPAGWDIVGFEENIKNFSRKDFVEYMAKHYIPQSTVVVIAGNFDEKEVESKVNRYFQKTGSKEKTQKNKVVEKQEKPEIKINYKDTDQTHLLMGVRSADMFDPDRYATALLGTVLGGGMSSRMFSEIREKRGLTYYIDSASEQATDTGYLFAGAGVEHQNLTKTIKLILEEFQKTAEREIGEKEIQKAKEYIKGKTLMSLESSSAVANFFGNQELFRKEIKKPAELFNKIDKVASAEIRRVAKKIFQDKNLNLAIIGPHKNEKEIQKYLNF